MRRLTAPSLTVTASDRPAKPAATRRASGARGQRLAPSWRRRLHAAGLAAALSAGLTLAVFVAVSDRPGRIWREVREDALDWSARNGLGISDIQAVGRRNTDGGELLAALGVDAETPILGLDLIDAQRRVESLPWVASAEVERQLPHTLRITITERRPIAILQAAGQSVLIDATGAEIVPVSSQEGKLPIVTGRGAPEHVADLIADLSSFPELAARVRAAVRVGDRRWDVMLDSVDSGIQVRLPELDAAGAWGRLSDLDRRHRLLSRGVTMIDLRLPDRLIVRLMDGKSLPASDFKPKGGRSA